MIEEDAIKEKTLEELPISANTQAVPEKAIGKSEIPHKDENPLIHYLRFKKNWVRVVIFTAITFFTAISTVVLFYYTFFDWIPNLWNWGTEPLSWKVVVSLVAIFFAVFLPFLPVIFLGSYITEIFSLFATDVEKEFKENLANIERQQVHYKDILDESDSEKLIPLITHSRIELEQYYSIALHQTTKSFRYSIGAMALGLFIIFIGMFSYIFPSEYINSEIRNGNFQPLVITSGIVLELISVIFLSIYKTSLGRLTYFYDRQVFIHNAMFAFKISKTMEEQDTAKKLIVEKILDFGSSSTKHSKTLIK